MPRTPNLHPNAPAGIGLSLLLALAGPALAEHAPVDAPQPVRPPASAESGAADGPRAALARALRLVDSTDAQQRAEGTALLRRAAFSQDPEVRAAAWKRIGRLQDDLLLRSQVDHDLTLDPAIPSAGAALFAAGETDVGVDLLIREAWLLNAAAERYLQILYEEPIEAFPRHDPRILAYFRAAAAEGIPTAQIFLGRIQLLGQGVPEDREAGMALLENAGHPQGYMELAQYFLLLNDEPTAARYWLRAADEFRFAPALFNLGVRAQREGSPQTARHYFEQALEQDPRHFGARLELARVLGQGGRDATDPARAIRLLESIIAEADGRVRLFALANLGLVYLDGVHVQPDAERALAMFREAEAGGLESVRPYIERLAAHVEPSPANGNGGSGTRR